MHVTGTTVTPVFCFFSAKPLYWLSLTLLYCYKLSQAVLVIFQPSFSLWLSHLKSQMFCLRLIFNHDLILNFQDSHLLTNTVLLYIPKKHIYVDVSGRPTNSDLTSQETLCVGFLMTWASQFSLLRIHPLPWCIIMVTWYCTANLLLEGIFGIKDCLLTKKFFENYIIVQRRTQSSCKRVETVQWGETRVKER